MRNGKTVVTKIAHGSPGHVCGQVGVGDELVSIDGFAVDGCDKEMFTRRAAAGARHSLVKLQLRHARPVNDKERVHDVGEQRRVLLSLSV